MPGMPVRTDRLHRLRLITAGTVARIPGKRNVGIVCIPFGTLRKRIAVK